MQIERRDFLKIAAATAAGAALPTWASESTSSFLSKNGGRQGGFAPLKVRQVQLKVGASRPFAALHVSDTHIVRADLLDGERKVMLAANRYPAMGYGEHYLDEAIFLARQKGAQLIHTGDMIDFVSQANLEFARRIFASDDWIVAAGNHEYSQYVGEAREDAAYKAQSAAKLKAAYPNDLDFSSRVVNGINFVSADDVYYNFTARQLELFEKEVEKGLPIVFLCHVPIHTPRHYAHQMMLTKGVCAYETGVPDELVATWKAQGPFPDGQEWRDRRVQQRTDEETAGFIKVLKAQKLVKAVLCGHCHECWEEPLSATATQYVAAATYKGEATYLEIT